MAGPKPLYTTLATATDDGLVFNSFEDNSGGWGYKANFAFYGYDLDMDNCFLVNATWNVSQNNAPYLQIAPADSPSSPLSGLTAKVIASEAITAYSYQGNIEIYPLPAGSYVASWIYNGGGSTEIISFSVGNNELKAKDLSSGTLASSISASTSTLSVYVGEGTTPEILSVWPNTPFYATIMPASPSAGVPNKLDSEIILVSDVSVDGNGNTTLSVSRGQRGTTAKAFSAGDIITNASYAEDAVLVGGGGSSETPSPWVKNEMIMNRAITSNKVYEGTLADGALVEVIGTTTGNTANFAWKFADGRLINFQRYSVSGNATSAWGAVYSGVQLVPRNYAVEFIALPIVSASLEPSSSSGNCWLAQANEAGAATTQHPCGYQLVRPTSMSGLATQASIVAYGFWK